MDKTIISITGHRLLTDKQKENVLPVIRKAIQNIMFVAREQDASAAFIALTPLAEGADTIFANMARSLGVPLKVILPFERSTYLKDFSSDKVRDEFDLIYNSVPESNRTVLGKSEGMELNQLYLQLGHKLVDESNYLIAVWNRKKGNGKGGTADIVAYAIEKKKQILLINPEDEYPYINYIHPDNVKQNRSGDIIDASETNHLTAYISAKQAEFDASAVLYNRAYKRMWATGFIIGLFEVFAFSVIISFHVSLFIHFLLSTTEFLCILIIISLVVFGKSKHSHSNYVHYRIISERLRIKKFFSELGIRIYRADISPIYFSFKEKPEYDILDNTIRLINMSAYSYLPLDAKKKRLEKELIVDQYLYHERKKEKFEKRNNQYKQVRRILFLVFFSSVALHFFHIANEFFLHSGIHLTTWEPPVFHSELFEEFVIFFSLFVPATIAACEALKYLYEWEKIINLSAAMAAYFRDKQRKLAQANSEEELELFLNAINKDMLIENLDWEKYMHDKNEVPT